MTSTTQIKRLTDAQNAAYAQRAALSAEISACEKRAATLKKERKDLDVKLAAAYGHDDEDPTSVLPTLRRFKDVNASDSPIVIIERRLIVVSDTLAERVYKVGDVLKAGYSYPKYSLVANDAV